MTFLDQLRIVSSIAAVAFFAIRVSIEIANFYIDREYKHIIGCIIWLLIVAIFVVRALTVPQIIKSEMASITISIMVLLVLALSIWWSVITMTERIKLARAARRIIAQGETSNAMENDKSTWIPLDHSDPTSSHPHS